MEVLTIMSISQLLNIKYPIFQGAMAQIAHYQLAAAVSEAGGLGIIASGGMTGEELRHEIRELKKLTDKPFGVNIMLMMKNIEEIVTVIIEEKVPVVTTGAGTPKFIMPYLKEAGIKVIPVVASVKHAQKMQELGADAVVAEGCEAGGHIGESTTMSMIPQIVDSVDIPVIAAGGMGDGRGVVAAFALGAQGVQLGTIFLASEECPISDAYKQAVLDANDTATAVTGRIAGAPVRCIRNEMTEKYIELERNGADREELEEITLGSLSKAVYEGDAVNGSMMSGQIAGLIKEIKPCAAIIEDLFTEAKTVLSQTTIDM
ncbi:nitronate monooxygenase [Streptococcus pluranimalium]|uniref:nitronate monooxygenase n=1 Tax=Streptococcus pluranimalium TaxID=82348 RepID=UPI0031396DD8